MKKRDLWIALIFAGLAFLLFQFRQGQDLQSTDPTNQGLDKTLSVQGLKVEVKKTKSLSGEPQLPSSQDKQKDLQDLDGYPYRLPDKDLAEFRAAEGGYAIAFGDVILGRIPDGAKVDRGVFDPGKGKLWRSPRIPYVIHPDVKNVKAIDDAIAYLEANTPIRLVPAQGDQDVVVFLPATELCASYLGNLGGQQPILVAPNCKRGELLHEIMHTLGFVHEQSRVDRDQYVEIEWSNIKEDFYNQFHIVPDGMFTEYRGSVFEFDYQSIMLYPSTAFAKEPGLETIKSRTTKSLNPETESLSHLDLERLYYLYGH